MKRIGTNAVAIVVCVLVVFVVASWAYYLYHPESAKQDVPSTSADNTSGQGKVLVVHSYHPEYEWVGHISAGIIKGLEGVPSEVRTFYMDTKRKNDEASKVAAGKKAMDMIAQWQPDIVIASDDDAQKYVASHYAGQAKPQVVFCAVNGDSKDYGYPAANVTGVLERPYFQETLSFLAVLRPGFKRIALLSEDSSTSELAFRFMRTTNTTFEVQSYTKCKDFAEWQQKVKDVQDKADAIGIYTYHSLKKAGTNENMPPEEIMRWTLDNSKLPVVAFLDFGVEDGALCGMVESGEEQGLRAGQLARMILGGRKASEFPIVESGLHGRKLLNIDTAGKMGISPSNDFLKLVEIVHTKSR